MSTQKERTARWLAWKRLPESLGKRLVDVKYDSLRYTLTFYCRDDNGNIGVNYSYVGIPERDWLTDEAIARICLEVP